MSDIKLTDPAIPYVNSLPADAIFYVVTGGVSSKIRKDALINALGIQFENRFEEVTGFNVVGQNITMLANWLWIIKGVNYGNVSPVTINIPFAAPGYNRIDIIVANTAGAFVRVAGVESTTAPVAPDLPLDTLQATFLVITETTISLPVEPSGGKYIGSFKEQSHLLNSVRRSRYGDFGFISATGVFEIAHFDGYVWNFYPIGASGSNYTAFNQMFIWNTGDALTFNLTAGFDANYLTIDNAPLRKVTDVANTYPIEWSQSGAVATIDPSVVTDETLVDGSIIYFTGIKTI